MLGFKTDSRVYLRSQKCWDIRQKAPDARRMSAALLCGMQANATQQMGLFGRIEQRWGVFRYTRKQNRPRTFCAKVRERLGRWSEWRDSNSRPPAPKAGALPTAQHPDMKLWDCPGGFSQSTCATNCATPGYKMIITVVKHVVKAVF